jgi:hypothetical protein
LLSFFLKSCKLLSATIITDSPTHSSRG